MTHLKLYEAYTEKDYQKALLGIKNMVQTNKPKEQILSYINKYYSDDAKIIDKLRIILDRIWRAYFNYRKRLIYERVTKTIRRRATSMALDTHGEYTDFKNSKSRSYFMFKEETKKYLVQFLSNEKSKYEVIMSKVDDNINTELIKFLFEKLFELLEWVNETAVLKDKIYYELHRNDIAAISQIEKLYSDSDFEDEVNEVEKIIRSAKLQIIKIINSF